MAAAFSPAAARPGLPSIACFEGLAARKVCLPFLRWLHRFGRPLGLPYPNRCEDRIRGFTELGLDTAEMEAHFAEFLGAETSARILMRSSGSSGLIRCLSPCNQINICRLSPRPCRHRLLLQVTAVRQW